MICYLVWGRDCFLLCIHQRFTQLCIHQRSSLLVERTYAYKGKNLIFDTDVCPDVQYKIGANSLV